MALFSRILLFGLLLAALAVGVAAPRYPSVRQDLLTARARHPDVRPEPPEETGAGEEMAASNLERNGSPEEVFRYRDRSGRYVYVDDPGKVPPAYREEGGRPHDLPRITRVKTFGYDEGERKPEAGGPKRKGKRLEVFVTPWCGYCKKLETFLEGAKIPFTRYDIEKDKKAAELYRALGGGGVPISRRDGEVVRGFDPDAVKRLVGR